MKLAKSTLILATCLSCNWAIPQEEDESVIEEIVVTGSLITGGVNVQRGGVQDIGKARVDVKRNEIPMPEDFTVEGLLGEYSINIPNARSCDALLCLIGETTRNQFITQTHDGLLTAISFASNIKPHEAFNQALNIVAVVDASGSMHGYPLDMVKASLYQLVDKLSSRDQLAIVIYDDIPRLVMASTNTSRRNRDDILDTIDAIHTGGATNMESGLELGYETAATAALNFDGRSRVILFTDERPNVGATESSPFMQLAIAASHRNIGLTTIGVSDHFGAELAAAIGSVRGGNVYYVSSEREAKRVFNTEFLGMVAELAHDLDLQVQPPLGFRVSGVYGAPKEYLHWDENNAVRIHMPSVFASNKQGALFVAMEKIEEAHLPNTPVRGNVDIRLQVVDNRNGQLIDDRISVPTFDRADASKGLVLGSQLIDQYLGLQAACQAHHWQNDQAQAYAWLQLLSNKMQNAQYRPKRKERLLVKRMLGNLGELAGYTGENYSFK